MLLAVRSATALHRLLDVLPVFEGDDRIRRLFTLVPGSDFDLEALAAIEFLHARAVPWEQACAGSYDLILAASPKGELGALSGTRVLLPHGAGFGKSVQGEGGSQRVASGLDPAYLTPNGRVLACLHALAHPGQVTRLAALSPQAAARAAVVGDPTLDRILASASRRDLYRDALGTGARRLVVLTSTWGPESLLRRQAGLPARLASQLPHDAYQLALVVHPNERSRAGSFDLVERLAPALDAGMILAGPHEEWATLLIAADAVVTDHGSTALYAAALGRPVISVHDGGGDSELIPGSPMAELLAHCPRLDDPAKLESLLDTHRPDAVRALADSAFAEQGRALERLREELYGLLDLAQPAEPAIARVLPAPRAPSRAPVAFAVHTDVVDGTAVHVERFPAAGVPTATHFAAEHGVASERRAQGAGLLFLRAGRCAAQGPHAVARTAGGWTADIAARYPGCRTAGVVVSSSLCVARIGYGTGALLSVDIEPFRAAGDIVYADPAAVLSAVHAWTSEPRDLPAGITCVIGGRPFDVRIARATDTDAMREC